MRQDSMRHNPMRRTGQRALNRSPLAMALLVAGGLMTTAMAAAPGQAPPAVEVQGQALAAAPQSRIEGNQAMDGAVAAALIGAISSQFGAHSIGVKLDRVAVAPASLRDRSVSGEGRLRIGDGESWIPFRFDAQYDTRTAGVNYPYLIIGDTGAAEPVALDSDIAIALDDRVGQALAREFAEQRAQLVIDRVTTAKAGQHYLRVEAQGTADFAGEGSTAARVQALYDRRTGEWLRVDYELGATSNWAGQKLPTVAVR